MTTTASVPARQHPFFRRDPSRWRSLLLVLFAVLLFGQVLAGQIQFFIGRDGPLLAPSAPPNETSTQYTVFIRNNLPQRETLLLFTATPNDGTYFQLSYALQPENRVWYSTPYPVHSPPDWWIRNNGSASDLMTLAGRLGAKYIAFYATPMPSGLDLDADQVLRPGFSLVRLKGA
jgi:hypothetical protein